MLCTCALNRSTRTAQLMFETSLYLISVATIALCIGELSIGLLKHSRHKQAIRIAQRRARMNR